MKQGGIIGKAAEGEAIGRGKAEGEQDRKGTRNRKTHGGRVLGAILRKIFIKTLKFIMQCGRIKKRCERAGQDAGCNISPRDANPFAGGRQLGGMIFALPVNRIPGIRICVGRLPLREFPGSDANKRQRPDVAVGNAGGKQTTCPNGMRRKIHIFL